MIDTPRSTSDVAIGQALGAILLILTLAAGTLERPVLAVSGPVTTTPKRHFYSMGEPTWAGPAADSPPVWSRDGREILFQQTREEGFAQIWAVRPDGTELRRITDGIHRDGHPGPCAVDDRLAFVSDRDGSRQIWIRSRDGSDVRRVTSSREDSAWPAFSPDCSQIVYVALSDLATGRYDLRVVDVESAQVRTLQRDVRFLGWPRWSADGRWILFHREIEGFPNHIWRVRIDGTGAAPVTTGDRGDYWAADPSRDGHWMSFAFGRREQLQWTGNADLWLVDLRTGACRQLTNGWWPEHGQRLSPDGRRLAFWDARSGYLEIRVLDLESGAESQVTHQPPTELTTIVRERGVDAALAFARSRPASEELFSERALSMLLESRAREGRPPTLDLARLLIDRHPESPRAHEAFARELFRSGELAEARAAYRKLLAQDQANPRSHSRLAALALLEDLTGSVLAELPTPLPERAVNVLGYALMRLERLDEAIDVFGWNVRAHPESANVYDSFGEALYWRGELAAAEHAYARASELDPTNVNAERFLDRIRSLRSQGASAPARVESVLCPTPGPRVATGSYGRAPSWAQVLEWTPDPAVVADAEVRRRIAATGAPWRVLHVASGIEMLLVPPGSYLRGAAADDPFDRENERPQHRVELTRAFYLGRYEVTNAQMRRFRPDHASGVFYRAPTLSLDEDEMPAVDVSWLDATAFAEHFGFRLPTEAEWEYAARAGVATRYPWGNDPEAGRGWGNGFNEAVQETIPEMDWPAFSWDDGYVVSAPVGSFRPNAWGFYDLFGNAWEWCRDVYREDEYTRLGSDVEDPIAEGEGLHTLRGGGWGNAPRGSGIPYRFGMDAADRFDANGFRVARSLED